MSQAITNAVTAFKDGEIVLLLDDSVPVTRAYFVSAARSITAEKVAFLLNHARGVICAPITEKRLRELDLPLMRSSAEGEGPAFAVSIEAREGTTTGISASDRAHTLHLLADPNSRRGDFVAPGHIFPWVAEQGGVLVRSGPAEAAVDLALLSEVMPVCVLSHVLDGTGAFVSAEKAEAIAAHNGLSTAALSEIIRYRLGHETLVQQIAETVLPTHEGGTFKALCYRSLVDDSEHLALVKGDPASSGAAPIVRVQAENPVEDLLSWEAGASRERMNSALRFLEQEGTGVFVYVRQRKKLFLQPEAAPSPNARLHEVGIGAQILRALGIHKLKLLTSNRREVPSLEAFGLEIVERIPF